MPIEIQRVGFMFLLHRSSPLVDITLFDDAVSY